MDHGETIQQDHVHFLAEPSPYLKILRSPMASSRANQYTKGCLVPMASRRLARQNAAFGCL